MKLLYLLSMCKAAGKICFSAAFLCESVCHAPARSWYISLCFDLDGTGRNGCGGAEGVMKRIFRKILRFPY